MAITIGVLREIAAGERRVALTPDVAKKLKAKGASILLEAGAGTPASFPDANYKDTEFGGDARFVRARLGWHSDVHRQILLSCSS